ncbi:MAG TPA: FAD-dependent thymidylate synthase [Acidimicrobiia bacterium]|nr:FAD-dependent thymidylate synthase [Acidimicrobiia bacterium]
MTAADHAPPPGLSPFREDFTDEETAILARHFTNTTEPVFALIGLPEVVKGALFARYSRSPKSLRRLFLDEFYDSAAEVGAPEGQTGTARADELYHRVFTQYGDDSVAQLGGIHLACEQASNLLTKILERGRLAAYLEQSTRYMFYDERLGDSYRYLVPPEVAAHTVADRYRSVLDHLFDTYASLTGTLTEHYQRRFPKAEGDSAFIYRSTIRARVCDDLRGLLPAATRSNVGIYANGQAYEAVLLRMRAHPLAEAREYADAMLRELRLVAPAFFKRVDLPDRGESWSAYLRATADATAAVAAALPGDIPERPEVTLVDWDPEAETKVVAAALYPHTDLPDDVLLEIARAMPPDERRRILRTYAGDRANRRHRPGRGMERSDYRFDILCDYGIFRDLQRHRILSLDWQRLGTDHGYVTPPSIGDINAEPAWHDAIGTAAELYGDLATVLDPMVAQYAVPFAFRIRFYMQLNAREAFHLIELRTAQGGHPDYRRVCLEMHRLIRDQAGHTAIADAMSFVDASDVELGRLETERAAEARRSGAVRGGPDQSPSASGILKTSSEPSTAIDESATSE